MLGELEAEVVIEALGLYLQTRPLDANRRFEYRYRAARAVFDNLAREDHVASDSPPGDDDVASTRVWDRRNVERLED
jgi:hypothetical protein